MQKKKSPNTPLNCCSIIKILFISCSIIKLTVVVLAVIKFYLFGVIIKLSLARIFGTQLNPYIAIGNKS